MAAEAGAKILAEGQGERPEAVMVNHARQCLENCNGLGNLILSHQFAKAKAEKDALPERRRRLEEAAAKIAKVVKQQLELHQEARL